jgi:hypothetical protein
VSRQRTGRLVARLGAGLAALSLGLASIPAAADTEAIQVRSVTPDHQLQQLWERYGDSGRGWTGADSTYSTPLPHGMDAWMFSDTFLGAVNPDHSRPADTPFIHNSVVLQSRRGLTTVTGGNRAQPMSLFGPTPPGPPTNPANVNPFWYWSGDGIAEGDTLRIFALKFVSTGTGPFDFRFDSDAIASFHLPDMRMESLTPTYSAANVTWGSWLLPEGGFTFVYGVEDLGAVKYMHLARAHRGHLLGPWEFFTGSGWSKDPASSARLMKGVSNEYSVTRMGGGYVLITFDTNVILGNEIVAYTASGPTGPFTSPTHVYATSEAGGNIFTYNAHAHPELGKPGELVVSYNVNSFAIQDIYKNVDDYRPRFIDVRVST